MASLIEDPELESPFTQQNKIEMDVIIYNIITHQGECILGAHQIPEHIQRTKFRKFIRTAQYHLFNPDRPRKTGNEVNIDINVFLIICLIIFRKLQRL
jgi:hypothetical protein